MNMFDWSKKNRDVAFSSTVRWKERKTNASLANTLNFFKTFAFRTWVLRPTQSHCSLLTNVICKRRLVPAKADSHLKSAKRVSLDRVALVLRVTQDCEHRIATLRLKYYPIFFAFFLQSITSGCKTAQAGCFLNQFNLCRCSCRFSRKEGFLHQLCRMWQESIGTILSCETDNKTFLNWKSC